MQASLKVTPSLLVLDLGEVRRLVTQDGPRLARYVAVMRAARPGCLRTGRGSGHAHLMRAGLPPGETLLYTLPEDPLNFEQEGNTLRLTGLRVYLAGPPEFVETPFYAWVEP
ncbi:hypothetical protein Mlute_00905 [Meiothermus luteus]|jgi:hypothetical protein|uniref:Uncharacterized protein n=1 Tax=Meiothermus luteus TaxID=2026184 RepID=A0A399EVY0_9DEIN|nr:hypothetical protein [Meiothermus luteus]RIH87596.1 hypothetical protein Mlute_00905 [Meiothermus luteus]RMH57999.1 MAG: hypothetical protein D6684_01865 [Deinococcota bacterium]